MTLGGDGNRNQGMVINRAHDKKLYFRREVGLREAWGLQGDTERRARLLDTWNWGGGVIHGELGPGTSPGPLPGRYEDLSESASLGNRRGDAPNRRTWNRN